jgi:hypothetical protein
LFLDASAGTMMDVPEITEYRRPREVVVRLLAVGVYNKRNAPLIRRYAVRQTLPWFLLVSLLGPLPGLTSADEKAERAPWTARPDPLPWKVEPASAEGRELALGRNGTMVYPSTSSPFGLIVSAGETKDQVELKMIDLRKLEQVGPTLKTDKLAPHKFRVSPWGNAVATLDTRAVKTTIKVWYFDDDRTVQPVELDGTNATSEWFDFAGKGQLITLKGTLWEVRDIRTAKVLSAFRHELEYDPRWVGLSAGRNYLAMEHNCNEGYFFLLWDLKTGKLAGQLDVQTMKEGFGICGGITFSPDGKEAALLWQQGGGGKLARIQRFDIEKGVKKGMHLLGVEVRSSDPGFMAGGMKTLQFLPDGSGWLLSGHQVIDRETGKVVHTVGKAFGLIGNTPDRRFVDGLHVTMVEIKKGGKKLSLLALPK